MSDKKITEDDLLKILERHGQPITGRIIDGIGRRYNLKDSIVIFKEQFEDVLYDYSKEEK